MRCEVCRSKVWRHLLGKHLVSHYHCRKARSGHPQATALVLENIHSVVRQAPFQCSPCKFYCNTIASFKQHWTSEGHKRTGSKVKEKYCNTKIAVGVVEAEQKWVALLVDGYSFVHKHYVWRTPRRFECFLFQICLRLTRKMLIRKKFVLRRNNLLVRNIHIHLLFLPFYCFFPW